MEYRFQTRVDVLVKEVRYIVKQHINADPK